MKKLIMFILCASIAITHVTPSFAQTQQSTTRKTINAAVKFIRRKPLTQEEKDLLKKVSISAALASAVAAITGVSAAAIKRKLEEEKRRAQKEAEQNGQQKGGIPSTPQPEKPAETPSETKWSWNQINSVNWDTPFLMFMFQQNEAPLKQLYCDYHNKINELKGHISLQILERGLEEATDKNFVVGKRVADYFIHKYKLSDFSIPTSQKSKLSIETRHLKEEMDNFIRCP